MAMQTKLAQDLINDNMMSYSSYVLTQRALPDYRDGLKPVARRIIYSMVLNNFKNFTKSATVEGKIFQLHPHGSTYGAIVNLTQKDRQNIPFLEGKGSWGQFTSNRQGAAASRYTEVKLGVPALEMTKEIKNDAVDMIPNYDGTIDVPEALPVTWPVILTNHSSGIGVGFSSDTVSYNAIDLRNVIENILNKKTILFKDILVPDFSTGGIILDNEKNREQLNSIYKTGLGSFTMRAKAKIEDDKIIVYELPFGVKREQIISKIVQLSKQKKLNEVKDIRDGTSFKGMKIVITLKNNVNKDQTLEKLFQLTPMQSQVSVNMNILHGGYPKVMGVEYILNEWIEWRKQTIVRVLNKKLLETKKELHLLKGLEKILINIDDVIKIIRFSKDDEIEKELMKAFKIDMVQAQYISEIKLRNINSEKITKQTQKIRKLEDEYNELDKNVKDEKFINDYLLKTMDESLSKFNNIKRKTEFIEVNENRSKIVFKNIKEQDDYLASVLITKQGYIFKMRNKSSSDVNTLSSKLLPNDEVESFYEIKNSESLYVFLTNSKVGRIKIDQLSEDGFIPTYLEIEENFIFSFKNDNNELIFIFEDGKAVTIPKSSFVSNRNVLSNAYYNKKIVYINNKSDAPKTFKILDKDVNVNSISSKKSRLSKGSQIVNYKELKSEDIKERD